jgi:radical SAM superfamily enzyme YgiQ (UPF0313 family)
MNILCVYPAFPRTYWGAEYTMRFVGRKSILPPLGLLTVAALLPADWNVKLCDLNTRALDEAELRWADAVFISGMIIQREGLHEIARAARKLGKPVIAGGPYASTSPADLAGDVDCVVVGEAEGVMPELVAALLANPRKLPARLESAEKPDVSASPTPRFDLLDVGVYQSIGVQYSRGCPFNCEFCDIIEIYGRKPRAKTPEQFCRELDAVKQTGFRGSVFVVDDNFIGNRPALQALLKAISVWLRFHKDPFDFYTEASINLAHDDALIDAMVVAGFTQVFVGIETPSKEALRDAQKLQNVSLDLEVAVRKLVARGLEVMAGFIVGFDSDDAQSLVALHEWISRSPIPLAMVGMLTALPGTQLERRLESEGRMLHSSDGDQFARPNFVTKLNEAELLEGYARVMADLYSPRAYFDRAAKMLQLQPEFSSRLKHPAWEGVRTVLRSLWHQGVVSRYRREFWRFVGIVARKTPKRISRAVGLAIHGEHMIRYTRDDLMPRLQKAIADAKQAMEQALVPVPVVA